MKKRAVWIILSALPALAQNAAPRVAPAPRDPLELAAGQIQAAVTTAQRDAAAQLLTRARNSYLLRNLSYAWDLKVHFTVNSRGQTNFDGDWEMEDVFAPGQGLHWAAKSSAGYAVTGIFSPNETYVDATGGAVIPLRLQEARAMLYNAIPSAAYAGSGTIRTVDASFRGTPVTCVLLNHSRNASSPNQRGWDESEDCIDQQSGLLAIHSEVPGRYTIYDYANAAKLGSRVLPRTIVVTEGGRTVSTISVESLSAISAPDAALFQPTDAMKAAGSAAAMTSATRISRVQAQGQLAPGAVLHAVCVFGLVNPQGRLVEAHSLQPSDPASDAAVKDAEAIDFSPATQAGAPQQHFVFVIEKFASGK